MRPEKHIFTRIAAGALSLLLCAGIPYGDAFAKDNEGFAKDEAQEVFFDDFSGSSLDTEKWLIAEKAWGGFNGGVVAENVSVSDGTLKLEGHGNQYTGSVKGVNKQLPGGVRTGAAIATREYFGSGSYEVVAKIAPELGACSAIWTFEYEEYYPGDPEYERSGSTGSYSTVNHEIDIELPTATDTHSKPDFKSARFNTYVAENRCNSYFMDLPYALDDDAFHTYRFDWHTGDKDEQARVDFYIDGKYLYTSTKYIPTNASRLWIGLWFPCGKDSDKDGYADTGWTGTADFDTTVFEIDSVKITPFHEAGDTVSQETYPEDGWASGTVLDSEPYDGKNLLANGDFADGSAGWTMSGSAQILPGKALLASGADTDSISQKVSVKKARQYRLSADVSSSGAEVILGVNDYNGRYTQLAKTTSKSGKLDLTFTTAGYIDEVEIFCEVLRYQDNKEPVSITNVVLVRDGAAAEDPVVEDPLIEDPVVEDPVIDDPVIDDPVVDDPVVEDPVVDDPVVENLLVNGDFSLGNKGWKEIGSARIADGKAYLASGRDTDIIEQSVSVKPETTYRLNVGILSQGSEVELIVSNYNGKYTHLTEAYHSNAKGEILFTTGKKVNSVKVKVSVMRYQEKSDTVIVDDAVLTEVR